MAGGSGRLPRVTVLMGGLSAEREVSLSSGAECLKALRAAGYEAEGLDAGPDLPRRLMDNPPEVVFNALHGRWGEDGCVQGLLEWLRIPYTHSGVLASALAMDKTRAKDALREAGLPVPHGVIVSREAVAEGHVLPPPYVVKPNSEGSSVGVYIVREGSNAPRLAETMPEQVLVEAYAPGREMTVAVLDGKALCVTDIITDGWYDYDAKYKTGGSRHVLPAELPREITEACLTISEKACAVLGCRGLARVDFRYDDARGLAGLIILEVNTQPGMTPTSLAPEQAALCGISFPELCDRLVRDATCDR
ncbi:D-alanine--D-alanine ligase [Pseudogemmobacter faecipullorum]|uniref:D-alanine--D-alanine ligase n=1 Tax=Pseudogemmobacter faecipullorum TaxID=2755041 RepID=A0ABS8CLC7_9RHOB|nr:D-alanine--D-alanine ligase [Pseudogemmobacter faecipullorum]MCB5410197.1 D-alanine--D-alanine ligase [Pseudogemmobacter faecipullorum]